MNELTLKQKAEAYDRALEIARKEYKTHESFKGFCEMLLHIFPELKESEDERIKSAAIKFVRQNKSFNYCLGISKEEVIAWLEKQGEQKYNLSIDNSFANTNFPFTAVVKSSNKLVNIISGQLNSDCKYYIKYQSDKADKYRIYEPDELVEQKPAEWGEEDEMIALSIEQVMNCASLLNIVPEKIDKIRTWLKSLKERVSKFDDGYKVGFSAAKYSQWKPSDGQISLLQAIINDPNNAASESCQIVLKEVIKQLKKLRKE